MKRVGIDQILEDLTDNDPEIKKLASKALLKDSSCSDELVSTILQDADKTTSAILYETLFDDDKDFPAVFHSAASDPDPSVRRMAIRYLFRRGAFALDDGIGWLKDPDAYVRRRVISYLFWINDRSALEPVVRMSLEDPEQSVRKDALRLVGIWGGKGEIPHAIKALEDGSLEVRIQAIRTLKRLTGEDFGEPVTASEDEFEWIIAKWQGWWELMKERI